MRYLLSILFIPCVALAASSIGDVAGNLNNTATVLAKVMWAACIVVGICLTTIAFTQFQTHRFNPKLVPLTTPILYLILGLIAICIPFAERIFGALDSYTAKDQRKQISQPSVNPNKSDDPSSFSDIDKEF